LQYADLVLKNANILTIDPSRSYAEAIAIKEEKIVSVGTDKEVQPWISKQTEVIDLAGKTVVPGFIDTHVHMKGFGHFLTRVNLRGIDSIDQMQQLLRKRVQKTPKGKWILGRGWDQERFSEKRYPTRWDLDETAPDNPVVFTRVCGHISVVNSKALELAEITRDAVAPSGGHIDRDPKTEEPTGILRENAVDLIQNIVPEPSDEELTEICVLACQEAVETGLTSVHWLVQSPVEVRILQKLRKEDKLKLRVYLVFPVEYLDCFMDAGFVTGFGDHLLKIGSIKILVDGSLGARTAALKQPYTDEPSTKGMMLYNQNILNKLVLKAHRSGFQLVIHAIGDRAIAVALTALEKALEEAPKKNHRHRLEHVSVLNDSLIQRMKKLNVIASVQPHFVVSDFWVENRLGKARSRWAYAFKTLIEKGVLVAGGSDCPVEPINPLLGICAAVNREISPQERISVEKALRIYTINAAYACFEEKTKGSIEVGKLADLTVLSDDLRKIEPSRIEDVGVEMTILGGEIVYCAKGLSQKG
jgi:predicted amidohydrolase YtcJ